MPLGHVTSGWLYTPRKQSLAVAFFKIYTFYDGSGYVHILDTADPVHTIWLETRKGFKKEKKFSWGETSESRRTDLWEFEW